VGLKLLQFGLEPCQLVLLGAAWISAGVDFAKKLTPFQYKIISNTDKRLVVEQLNGEVLALFREQ
jgi:hypothetical protein